MERNDLDYLIERTYAVLGKASPRAGIKEVIFENCKYFDRKSIEYLEDCINDLESMPGNLSKAFRAWYAAWNNLYGTQEERLACSECHGEGGFWVWRDRALGNEKKFMIRHFSPCPKCNRKMWSAPGLPPSYDELKRRGVIVMPPKYRNSNGQTGAIIFERDMELAV